MWPRKCARLLIVLSTLTLAGLAAAQPPKKPAQPPASVDEPDDKAKLDAEEERERLVADRFRRVLEASRYGLVRMHPIAMETGG